MRQCGSNSLSDQFGGFAGPFRAKCRAYPSTSPCVFDPLCKRSGRDPEGATAIAQEHDATAGRRELRRADLLAIVVPIRKTRCGWIGAMRNAPSLVSGNPGFDFGFDWHQWI